MTGLDPAIQLLVIPAQAGIQRMSYSADMTTDLIADLYLYPTEEGGRKSPIAEGFRCPSYSDKNNRDNGWTCFPHVGLNPLSPGERRRVQFSFLSPEAEKEMRKAGIIYLWDARFIGEATVLNEPSA